MNPLSEDLQGIYLFFCEVERGEKTAYDAFNQLLQAYSCQNVHFPSNRVCKRPRIEELLRSGHHVSEISERLGVTVRYVFYVRERMNKRHPSEKPCVNASL